MGLNGQQGSSAMKRKVGKKFSLLRTGRSADVSTIANWEPLTREPYCSIENIFDTSERSERASLTASFWFLLRLRFQFSLPSSTKRSSVPTSP